MKMAVNEIFDSIQGEGWYQGVPATFLRLQGCNLRCPWCDTKQAWNSDGEHDREIEDVATDILNRTPDIVVITGGEPLLQARQLYQLTNMLKDRKMFHLETNGTVYIPLEHPFHYITISPKPPDYSILCDPDELKFIITKPQDFQVAERKAANCTANLVSLQPLDNNLEIARLIIDYLIKRDRIGGLGPPRWKLSLQLHKLIGVK